MTKEIDHFLDQVQAIILSFLTKLGPFFVALMPALFQGYVIYHIFQPKVGQGIALLFALVVMTANETVGIVAAHTAVDLYNGMSSKIIQPAKFWIMAGLVPVYTIIVASVVFLSKDTFDPLVKGLGVASPFLTVIVYIAVALARDLAKTLQVQDEIKSQEVESANGLLEARREIEAEERSWQREKERLEIERKHEEKMARIEVSKSRPRAVQEKREASNLNVQMSKEDALRAILELLSDNPDASLSLIGRKIGRSKSTAENYTKQLMKDGKLTRNGHGWEVNQATKN